VAINPKKKMVLDLLAKGWTDRRIAIHCQLTITTIRYYKRTYTPTANIRQKYTPQIVEALIHEKQSGNLALFIETYEIPPTSVSRLLLMHEQAQELRKDLELLGWFRMKSTKECFAAGLSRNQVAASVLYLKSMRLSLQVWQGKLYLFYRGPALVTRFRMTFKDQVEILRYPKAWLADNKQRLKEGWLVIRKTSQKRMEARLKAEALRAEG